MTETEVSKADAFLTTYRYLRLVIVVVVFALGVSVLIERAHASCWQESISAYYYTPAHSLFVGALVAIGACLIAIKGSTPFEDVFLNVAGMLAPVVAFVPTAPSKHPCAGSAAVGAFPSSYISNNVLSLAIGAVAAVVLAAVVAHRHGDAAVNPLTRIRAARQPVKIGLAVVVGLIVVELIWYFAFHGSFLTHAHSYTAIAMFIAVGLVVVRNTGHAKPPYQRIYRAVAWSMGLSAVVLVLIQLFSSSWRHAVLWLEILETVPFFVYWVAQTFEHWDAGIVTTPANAPPP